jgi:hypothetical protein
VKNLSYVLATAKERLPLKTTMQVERNSLGKKFYYSVTNMMCTTRSQAWYRNSKIYNAPIAPKYSVACTNKVSLKRTRNQIRDHMDIPVNRRRHTQKNPGHPS